MSDDAGPEFAAWVKDALERHELAGKPYYVAILLIGAYQDVMGDYHNLFGRVDEAHVVAAKAGGARITRIVPGDNAEDVLKIFGHDAEKMVDAIEDLTKAAMKEKRLTRSGANDILAEYREAIVGYTYLDVNE